MDDRNYVAPSPDGGYVVVRDGQVVGKSDSQQDAERIYNNYAGQPNAPTGPSTGPTTGGKTYQTPNGPRTIDQMRQELAGAGYNGAGDDASIIAAYNRTASGGGGGGDGGGGYNWAGLGDALGKSNEKDFQQRQQQIDAQIRDIDARIADAKGRLQIAKDESARQQAMLDLQRLNSDRDYLLRSRDQYSQLAQALLSGAVSLDRPQDWLKYAQYTSGGRDIMKALFGGEALPQFGAPTGYSKPMGIDDVLKALGITPGTVPGADSTRPDLIPGGTPAAVPAGWYQQMVQGYGEMQAKLGRKLTRDEFAEMVRLRTGLSADIGRKLYDDGNAYTAAFGHTMDEATATGWLRQQLGLPAQAGGATTPGGTTTPPAAGGTATDPNAALDAIWRSRTDLATLYQREGWPIATPDQQRAIVRDWLKMTDDREVAAAGRDPVKYAQSKGWLQPATPMGATAQGQGMALQPSAPVPSPTPMPGRSVTPMPDMNGGVIEGTRTATRNPEPSWPGPTGVVPLPAGRVTPMPDMDGGVIETPEVRTRNPQPEEPMIPLPHQINPAVWDSMSDTQKQLILAAAKAGRTPSGYWEPSDYVRQIEAARPKGYAPRQTTIDWGKVMGAYG